MDINSDSSKSTSTYLDTAVHSDDIFANAASSDIDLIKGDIYVEPSQFPEITALIPSERLLLEEGDIDDELFQCLKENFLTANSDISPCVADVNAKLSPFRTVNALRLNGPIVEVGNVDNELYQNLDEKFANAISDISTCIDNINVESFPLTTIATLSLNEPVVEGNIDDELHRNLNEKFENAIPETSTHLDDTNTGSSPFPAITTLSLNESVVEEGNIDDELHRNLNEKFENAIPEISTHLDDTNTGSSPFPAITTLSLNESVVEEGNIDDELHEKFENAIPDISACLDDANAKPLSLQSSEELLKEENDDEEAKFGVDTVDNLNGVNRQSIPASDFNEDNWVEYLTDEGFPYLYNTSTYESKWKFSYDYNHNEMHYDSSVQVEGSIVENAAQQTEWVACTSFDGNLYYYNLTSGISQWDDPNVTTVPGCELIFSHDNAYTAQGYEHAPNSSSAEAVHDEANDPYADNTLPATESIQTQKSAPASAMFDESQLSPRSSGMRTISLYSSAYERTKAGLHTTQSNLVHAPTSMYQSHYPTTMTPNPTANNSWLVKISDVQSNFQSRQKDDTSSASTHGGTNRNDEYPNLEIVDYDEAYIQKESGTETTFPAPAVDERRYFVSDAIVETHSQFRYQEERIQSSEFSNYDSHLQDTESPKSPLQHSTHEKDLSFEEAVLSSLTLDDQTARHDAADRPDESTRQSAVADSKIERHLQIWSRFLQNASQAAANSGNENIDTTQQTTNLTDSYPRPKGPPPSYIVEKNSSTRLHKTSTGSRKHQNRSSQSVFSLNQQFMAPDLPWPVKLHKKQYYKLLKLVLPAKDESISEINYQQNEEDDEEMRIFKSELREMQNNALLAACLYSDVEVIELLLLAGADANYQDENVRSPAHFSCLVNDKRSLEVLYNHSADLDITDKQQRSPLHTACQNTSDGCVSYLLQCGVNVNSGDIYGNTPLHYAASVGNLTIVMALLEYGAMVTAKNLLSQTPVNVATLKQPSDPDKGWLEMITFLATSEFSQGKYNSSKGADKSLSENSSKYYSRATVVESNRGNNNSNSKSNSRNNSHNDSSKVYSTRESEFSAPNKSFRNESAKGINYDLRNGNNTSSSSSSSNRQLNSDKKSMRRPDKESESGESEDGSDDRRSQSEGSSDVRRQDSMSDNVSSDDGNKEIDQSDETAPANNNTVWSLASLLVTTSWKFFAFSSDVASESSDEESDVDNKVGKMDNQDKDWLANNRFSSALAVKRGQTVPRRNDVRTSMSSRLDTSERKSNSVKSIVSPRVDSSKQSWLNLKEAPPTADELEKYGYLTQTSFLKKQNNSQNSVPHQHVDNERSLLVTPRSQPPSDVMLAVAMAKKRNDSDVFNAGDAVAGLDAPNQPNIEGRVNAMNISSDSSDDDLLHRHRGTRIRTPMGGRSRKNRHNTSNHVSNIDETSQHSSTASDPNAKSVDVSERFKALSIPVKQDIRQKQENIYSLSAGVYPYGRYVDVLSSPATLNK